MEYTVSQLAKMSGVSTRTLRYYDEIGLLSPVRIEHNKYRIYGKKEVDLLQQILFYRELGVSLERIDQIIKAPDFDKEMALEEHLSALLQRKDQIESLIDNVTKTIRTLKGETIMTDKEKFEGFKKKMISKNEAQYGKEIREKYGDDAIDASYENIKGMSKEKWEESQKLSGQINELLQMAFEEGDSAGPTARKVCELHGKWLCMFWKEGTFSEEAHKALADGYVADERFTAYYDKIAPGCTRFLRDAIYSYYKK